MKKILIGGIVGGIVYHLLGGLLYGKLLMGYMQQHHGITEGFYRPQPIFLYLIIGNLLCGFLLAYIFSKSNISSVGAGLMMGGVFGLLTSASMDSVQFAVTTLQSRTGVIADVIGFTVLSAVAGAAIAAVQGSGKKV
jgi:uncharacterized membrane protein